MVLPSPGMVLESRLDDVPSHGAKEGLVERAEDWEGPE